MATASSTSATGTTSRSWATIPPLIILWLTTSISRSAADTVTLAGVAAAPLPPDEARERQIKALATENKTLKDKVRVLAASLDEARAATGAMSFETESAIANCLHPEATTPTLEQRVEAYKHFNGWKAANKKAQRGQA